MVFKKAPSFSVRGEKFNVIILAAGAGTRLKPETDYIPKALVQLGGMRAIDFTIQKYQYIADRLIVAAGHGADILENYVMGKYSKLNPVFSREKVSELAGPGRSLMLALDCASSRIPTLVTFCDYLVEEYVPVDHDSLGVSQAPQPPYIVDSHPKGLVVVEGGVVMDLVPNPDLQKETYGGFTGLVICHNTTLLKTIAYMRSHEKDGKPDYTFDIVKEYVDKVKTLALPLSRMFEFGTPEMLEKVRAYVGDENAGH
jgi:NDP-sugar pyrophosphorylase family protein